MLSKIIVIIIFTIIEQLYMASSFIYVIFFRKFLNLILTNLLDIIPFESFEMLLSEMLKSKVAISC